MITPAEMVVAIYLTSWYQPNARNGYGAHVAVIVREGQEIYRVRRAEHADAVAAAREHAQAHGLMITHDNTVREEAGP